jgi:putative DNA primase/helicase
MLSLEGSQGKGKSTAVLALAGADWFTDNLPHNLADKDAQQGLAGKWIVEFGELNSLFTSGNKVAKSFLSRQFDYFRPSYGRGFVDRPRQCIFVGTTNEDDYLTDATGNRRYWPVQCVICDVAWIKANRDQLWAEAAMLEAAGERLWLDTAELQQDAAERQSSRVGQDVWTEKVRNWLLNTAAGPRTEARTAQIAEAIGVPTHLQNKGMDMRIAGILKSDGWAKHRYWGHDGKTQVAWFAPGAEIPGRSGERVPILTAITTSGQR